MTAANGSLAWRAGACGGMAVADLLGAATYSAYRMSAGTAMLARASDAGAASFRGVKPRILFHFTCNGMRALAWLLRRAYGARDAAAWLAGGGAHT